MRRVDAENWLVGHTFGLFPRKAEIFKFFLAKLEQSIQISNGLTSTIKRQPQDVWCMHCNLWLSFVGFFVKANTHC